MSDSRTEDEQATHLTDIIDGIQLRGQSTMYAEELLVHDRGEGKAAEGIHASIVDLFRIFVFAYSSC